MIDWSFPSMALYLSSSLATCRGTGGDLRKAVQVHTVLRKHFNLMTDMVTYTISLPLTTSGFHFAFETLQLDQMDMWWCCHINSSYMCTDTHTHIPPLIKSCPCAREKSVTFKVKNEEEFGHNGLDWIKHIVLIFGFFLVQPKPT